MSIVGRARHHYDRASGPLRGMLLIGLSAFGFSLMHVMIRLLTARASLHPFEVAFFRNLFGVVALLPILLRRGPAVLRTGRLPLHALRSVLGLVAMLLFFSALQRTALPKVTALLQNYPNPFRDETRVRFDLATASEVTLEVFDVQGRLVLRPLSGRKLEPGHHAFEIKGLPRGPAIYFYRLQAGRFSASRRMVLLK